MTPSRHAMTRSNTDGSTANSNGRMEALMDENLIYDVGVHDGSDTAYYLHLGYHVVGIEANPIMFDMTIKRFLREIHERRFIPLNIGVAATVGQMDFWVCDDVSEWSSFNSEIASRNGAKHHSVTVKTRTFQSILNEFGVPFYCKSDIEGNDRLCLQGLNPGDLPVFVSIEMSHGDAIADLNLLFELGYRKFKIISQVTWAQPLPFVSKIEPRLRHRPRTVLQRIDRNVRGVTRDGNWVFCSGSSGAFGDKTQGDWVTREKAAVLWQILHEADIKYGTRGVGGNWYDIHASRSN